MLLQYGQKNKTIELFNIKRHFGDLAVQCIALFDDMDFNRPYANNVSVGVLQGMKLILSTHVSPSYF